MGHAAAPLVIAPFLSSRAREVLTSRSASYIDGTGNRRIVLRSPGLFVEWQGAEKDPNRKPRPLRSLKGATAGRVIRALCDYPPPYGVRELAEASRTPLGSVARVVALLEEEAIVTRDEKKRIVAVDWAALLRRWVEDYDVKTSNRLGAFLEPRGIGALGKKLRETSFRYAVTGSMAGVGVAPARLAMVYVDDMEEAAKALGLVPAEAGANVWLLEPYDDVVFEHVDAALPRQSRASKLVAPSQAVVDLLTSPGRGPQEAEALMERMQADERAWRRSP